MKRFSYRVYASPAQDAALSRTFGCVRVVFNDAVAARRAAYAAGQPYPKFKDLSRKLITEAKLTPGRVWLGEVSSVVLQQALRDEDLAERNFFDSICGRRKGRRLGRPRFRSRRDNRHTARFTANARFKVRVIVGTAQARLRVPGIPGELRLAYSRPLPSVPSSVTLVRECDGVLFASFVVQVPDVPALPVLDRHAGVDLGLTDFAAIVHSDGTREKVPNPRYFRAQAHRLKRAQQDLSRKQKGSKNRDKARIRVARLHRNVSDARLEHAHTLALALVRENQTISVEALNVRGMARSRGKNAQGRRFRKSVHDAGWAQFLRILTEKADEHGRTVTVIDPAYTSQTCSVCGVLDGPKPLNIREWRCQDKDCGAWLDRDYNAAVNIMIAAGHAVTACRGDVRLILAHAARPSADPVEAGTTPATEAA
jgi:putative transposase